MRTPLCDMFGIEYPIFAFTHCRDVVAAVSKAGGLGVLGAVGFSPEQLEIELDWIDDNVNGMPYGVDTVMPQKAVDVHGANADDMLDQIRSMIDANHWRYVDELMERFELPPLPEGDNSHSVCWVGPTMSRSGMSTSRSGIPSSSSPTRSGRRRRTSSIARTSTA